MTLKARVFITLKEGVLDPQGEAVKQSLGTLGFGGIQGVRQGKMIDLELTETNPTAALAQAEDMCAKLLANTVIENYSVEILK